MPGIESLWDGELSPEVNNVYNTLREALLSGTPDGDTPSVEVEDAVEAR